MSISQKSKYLKIVPVLLLILILIAAPYIGHAQCDPKVELCNPLQFDTLTEFIEGVVKVARDIGILIAVLGIVYAGMLKVTARGDEEKLKKANKAFLWSVMGTAVILGAWLIAIAIQGTVQQVQDQTKTGMWYNGADRHDV